MDPISIIMLVGLIISAATGADQALASGLNNKRNSELSRTASKLGKEIADDQTLLENLRDAYARRDAAYANSLLNTSPFGQRFLRLKREYLKNQDNIRVNAEQIRTQQIRATEAQNKLNEKQNKSQSTGSAIVDLISGAATADTSAPKYERVSDPTNK